MDRREMLKKLALGGITIVGGTGLLAAPAISAPGGNRGKPGTEPTPTPDPTPAPGDPIGVPLTAGSSAFVEFLTYKGGKGAKARLRVAEAGGAYHGWQPGGTNDTMKYESMSLEYVNEAIPVAGDATYPAYLDVKAGFGSRPYTGSFSFHYWHGPTSAASTEEHFVGVYTDATYYLVTVHLLEGTVTSFAAAMLLGPPTSDQLVNVQL